MKYDLKQIIKGAFIIAVVVMTLPISAFGRSSSSSNYAHPLGIDLSTKKLKDGMYTGTANAYNPGLTVAVTVVGGKVTGIKVTEHNEDGRRFYDYPIQVIPSAIIKKQNTKVDAVSGASATSYGIMAAVENALVNAM